jgi:hypothetical protein
MNQFWATTRKADPFTIPNEATSTRLLAFSAANATQLSEVWVARNSAAPASHATKPNSRIRTHKMLLDKNYYLKENG